MAAILCLCIVAFSSCRQNQEPWHWEKGTIVLNTPERPAGQEPAIGLTADPIPVVRIGFVGLGKRGPGAVERYTYIDGVRIVALCDYERDRAEACQKILSDAGLPEAAIYSGEEGYKELCEREDINLVYIVTDWGHHVPIARYAMEHGKHVAIEVPAALTVEECWQLVDVCEQTRLHCVMLENCCYDFFEMNTLNMAQQGVFGEVVRAEGAYLHHIWFWHDWWHNWQLNYMKSHRGCVYPTHGLGPVAQVLNINRGDQFRTLTAMDTKVATGQLAIETFPNDIENPEEPFRNGDHSTVLIRTEQGKVIELQYDVLNPQPYNRRYQLTGTRGYANKYLQEGYALSEEQLKSIGIENAETEGLNGHHFLPEAVNAELVEKYESPIAKKYQEKARQVGGHGGMDYIMDCRLVYCLQNGLPMDIDVYDAAAWSAVAELSAISMENDNAAVRVPDFTRGHSADRDGFRYAYASPEQEAVSDSIAFRYTQTLKAEGPEAAESKLKEMLEAQGK